MRKMLINCLLGGVMGAALGFMGYGATTAEFWCLFAVLIATQINSAID